MKAKEITKELFNFIALNDQPASVVENEELNTNSRGYSLASRGEMFVYATLL